MGYNLSHNLIDMNIIVDVKGRGFESYLWVGEML